MKWKKSDRPGDCPKDYPGIFADEEKRTGNELLYQCLICDYGKRTAADPDAVRREKRQHDCQGEGGGGFHG